MGDTTPRGFWRPAPPGAPELHIRLVSIMGETKVRFSRTRRGWNRLHA